jgi:hypothetical protein
VDAVQTTSILSDEKGKARKTDRRRPLAASPMSRPPRKPMPEAGKLHRWAI